MPQTRLLRGLSTAIPRRATAVSSLSPPYSHPLPPSSTPAASAKNAFTPPYAHSLEPRAANADSDPIAAPYRFSLIPNAASVEQARADAWSVWATEALSTPKGRDRIHRLWVQSIVALEKVKSLGNQIPQVPFRSLAEHLSEISPFELLGSTGAFVVRDVVADADAQTWAAELLRAIEARGARPVFWHDALLAARAHHSVRSVNSQVLTAFAGADAEPSHYVQADTVQVGLGSSPVPTTSHSDLWDVNQSHAPFSPVTSHLALTPSTHGASTVSPSIQSAIYASLRPLFRPIKSRLSFYHSSAYLDPANWELLDVAPAQPDPLTTSLPHVEGTAAFLPALSPGDMVIRHSSLPLSPGADEGIYLPVSPLPRTAANEQLVADQKKAFEQGIPPPHVRTQGLVALERAGTPERIPTNGGRRAMGYE